MEKVYQQKSINDLLANRDFVVAKETDHALQRIIEAIQDAGIFKPEDTKWGVMYWRALLKRHCKKHNRTYQELEGIVGKAGSHGLLKELQDVPSKYPAYGWLRNRLK